MAEKLTGVQVTRQKHKILDRPNLLHYTEYLTGPIYRTSSLQEVLNEPQKVMLYCSKK